MRENKPFQTLELRKNTRVHQKRKRERKSIKNGEQQLRIWSTHRKQSNGNDKRQNENAQINPRMQTEMENESSERKREEAGERLKLVEREQTF